MRLFIGVFPAPAGINRPDSDASVVTGSVPRASGDKPVSSVLISSLSCVFPAPAGINRGQVAGWSGGRCVPRASGDKPKTLKYA
ncbi:hypothetical protein QE80_003193 [Salmonella enterica subsp. enterica]|nr:hypothetical protein [Salmonella enterica subsp. enterica]